MSISKATAAPITLEINNHAFVIQPPSFAVFGEFESWAEEDLLRQALNVGADVEKAVLRGSSATKALIGTTRGGLRFACLVLRKAEPTITPNELANRLSTMDEVMEIVNAALEHALPEARKGGESSDKPF